MRRETAFDQGGPGRLARWGAAGIAFIVVALVPWTAHLAETLPARFQAHDWDVAWVGFDAALTLVLAYTAWAWFRRRIVGAAALVAATLLACDAWFDVTTSLGTRSEPITIFTAVCGEVPLALFLVWVAWRNILRRRVLAAVPVPSSAPVATAGRDPE